MTPTKTPERTGLQSVMEHNTTLKLILQKEGGGGEVCCVNKLLYVPLVFWLSGTQWTIIIRNANLHQTLRFWFLGSNIFDMVFWTWHQLWWWSLWYIWALIFTNIKESADSRKTFKNIMCLCPQNVQVL